MYHPFTEAMALTLVDVPITLFTLIIFSVILYFLVKLQQSAEQFFVFYLLLVTVTLCMKVFFRLLAAGFRREAGAQALGGVTTLVSVLYTGYSIPRPSMIGALRWLAWINVRRFLQ